MAVGGSASTVEVVVADDGSVIVPVFVTVTWRKMEQCKYLCSSSYYFNVIDYI